MTESDQKIIDSLELKIDRLEDEVDHLKQINGCLAAKCEELQRVIAAQKAVSTLDARLMKLGYTG